MDMMHEALSAWHWLALGLFLLILETLGVGGFFIGMAVASLIMALYLVAIPEAGWAHQLVVFSALSLVCTLIYWKRFRRFNDQTDQQLLNNRVAQMLGQRHVLRDAISNGRGHLQIGDTLWKVQCTEDLPANTNVEITGAEGMSLIVKRAS
jgi:membrane protein implicated in regulation of membrane protease activity